MTTHIDRIKASAVSAGEQNLRVVTVSREDLIRLLSEVEALKDNGLAFDECHTELQTAIAKLAFLQQQNARLTEELQLVAMFKELNQKQNVELKIKLDEVTSQLNTFKNRETIPG